MTTPDPALQRTIAAVWRIESAKVVAVVARMVRDVGVAEDLAQDVLLAALEQWSAQTLPDNPAAWLTAAAKRRAIDWLRRQQMLQRQHEQLGHEAALHQQMADNDPADALAHATADDIGDDLLRLIFVACHPVLGRDAQIALTLRLLGGLATDEIARAFLLPEATIAQRIVRAKRALADARVPFEVPPPHERPARRAAVLSVLYLIFNEGYAATAGDEWMRPTLCHDALRLVRILAELMPHDAEVHALAALLEIQASRLGARRGRDGEPVLLLDQDRTRWDRLLIVRGLDALARADTIARAAGEPPGPYALQAAIAACHARAATAGATDWPRIAALYGSLAQTAPSPVVELNRAVAVGMADGPEHGLAIADALLREPALRHYHLLPSVRADLLDKLGRQAMAQLEFERAASMTRNARERTLLLERARRCAAAAAARLVDR